MKSTVVATYDYYTLEQAERILYRRKSERKKRKERMERIKFNLMLFSFYVLVPAYFILEWLINGY